MALLFTLRSESSRFLNEMIKLVSPKYLGSQTPKPVRDRVLQLMYSWTVDYPRETKIKEAYQMLRKQGVVSDEPPFDGLASGSSSKKILCLKMKRSSVSFRNSSRVKIQRTSRLQIDLLRPWLRRLVLLVKS